MQHSGVLEGAEGGECKGGRVRGRSSGETEECDLRVECSVCCVVVWCGVAWRGSVWFDQAWGDVFCVIGVLVSVGVNVSVSARVSVSVSVSARLLAYLYLVYDEGQPKVG